MTAASTIKSALSYLSFRSGLTQAAIRSRNLFSPAGTHTFTILNYHRVNNFNDAFTIDSVSVKDFENQMHHVSKYYHVLSLEEIYTRLVNQIPLPGQYLAITFDDGYADNYFFAYPILKKYRVPATIFLTAGCINERVLLWFDKVLSAFRTTRKKQFKCPLSKTVFSIDTHAQKIETAHLMLEKLKRTDQDRKTQVIYDIVDELETGSNDHFSDHSGMLTWDMVREMAKDGVSFGSHTMTHPILANLSESALEWELSASRQIIEHQLGQETSFFAYPNGKASDFNENVVQAVRRAGYKAALTTVPVKNTITTDYYHWGRYKPWQNAIEAFSMALFLHGWSTPS